VRDDAENVVGRHPEKCRELFLLELRVPGLRPQDVDSCAIATVSREIQPRAANTSPQ